MWNMWKWPLAYLLTIADHLMNLNLTPHKCDTSSNENEIRTRALQLLFYFFSSNFSLPWFSITSVCDAATFALVPAATHVPSTAAIIYRVCWAAKLVSFSHKKWCMNTVCSNVCCCLPPQVCKTFAPCLVCTINKYISINVCNVL